MSTGPTTELPLFVEKQVVIGADGTGWIRGVGPAQYGEEWEITSTTTRVENSIAESRLYVFANGTTRRVDGTYSGNQDTSNTVFKLRSGELLNFQYERATPGAVGFITLDGTRKIAGRRGY